MSKNRLKPISHVKFIPTVEKDILHPLETSNYETLKITGL
jgi:hypothetical protein